MKSAQTGIVIEVPGIERRPTPCWEGDNAEFLSSVLKPRVVHHLSRQVAGLPDIFQAPTSSLLVQAANGCFAEHVPFCLRPEVAWYMITHEVATYVKQNARDCAHFFTSAPGEKQEIHVRDDSLRIGSPDNDWVRALGLFEGALRERISAEVVDRFLPELSTMGPEEKTAILVCFMDTVSEYYEFHMHTLCGIPLIRLEGTAEDWRMVHSRAKEVSQMFEGLQPYFRDLVPVLDEVGRTAEGRHPDAGFWGSMYKMNGGSGGPYVNGWLTSFVAFVPGGRDRTPTLRKSFNWQRTMDSPFGGITTDAFPSHVSAAPMIWHYLGRTLQMRLASGIFGVELDGEFVTPRLGFGVIED